MFRSKFENKKFTQKIKSSCVKNSLIYGFIHLSLFIYSNICLFKNKMYEKVNTKK